MPYAQLKQELNSGYQHLICGHSHNLPYTMQADDNSELMSIAEEMAKDIYSRKKMVDKLPDELISGYAAKLLNAITIGYGMPSTKEDEGMLHALRNNVYHFSAAKGYTQAKSLTEALLDENGKLRTWSQFKAVALTINNEQVNQWLAAEYQNAIAASQMARKWQEIIQHKAILPFLKYVTAHDGRVRPAHAAMDGITLPVDHPFWKTYFPPNGWGCRCLIIQLAHAVVTKDTDIYFPTDKEVPKMFRFNPGIEQQVFSKEHAYFKDLPAGLEKQYGIASPNPNYISRIEGKKGGYVDISENTDKNKKEQHIEAAKVLANEGIKIELQPEINAKEKVLRKKYFPELKENNHSNPDARFNGILGDFKIPDSQHVGSRTIRNALKSTAKKEVEICAISLLDRDYSMQEVLSQIRGSLINPSNHESIKQVLLITANNNVLKIPREFIIKNEFYKNSNPLNHKAD